LYPPEVMHCEGGGGGGVEVTVLEVAAAGGVVWGVVPLLLATDAAGPALELVLEDPQLASATATIRAAT